MEYSSQKILRIIDADLVCECKTISDPVDPTLTLHNHDGFEVLLMLNGNLNLFIEGSGKKLTRGDLICLRPYIFHRAELLSEHLYDRIVINFKEDFLKNACSEKSDIASSFNSLPANTLDIIHLTEEEIQQFADCAASLQKALQYKEFGDDLLVSAYFAQLMVMINRHTITGTIPKKPEIIPKLVSDTFTYIESHITEEITIKALEGQLHHNGSYISRCFKKITGTSLQQYIIAKKITHSQTLLRMGYSPCDVCFMTGFNNYSNFSRTFSKMTGASPKQYQIKERQA